MRTRPFLLLLVILALALGFVLSRQSPQADGVVAVRAAAGALQAPGAGPHAGGAAPAQSVTPSGAASAVAVGPVEAAWRKLDADWCARASTLPVDPLELKDDPKGQMLSTLLDQEESLSGARYWNELLLRLRSRPDLASQASAEFVARGNDPEGGARLLDMALRSGDPFVAALAAQSECGHSTPCARPGAKRWQALEPDNLLAWLIDPPDEKASPADWDAYLDRLAQTRRANTYRAELMQRLWDQDGALDPGVRRLARRKYLTEFAGMLPLMTPSRSLLDFCAFKAGEGQRKERCAQVAERLWQSAQPAVIERAMTVALAGASGLRDDRWKARAQETEAAMTWMARQVGDVLETLLLERTCKAGDRGESRAREWIRLGEADAIVATMRSAGVDERALSESYRTKRKRSMLSDRLPPRASVAP